jgi:asparagine synthase (glutamine-hydrolysing)
MCGIVGLWTARAPVNVDRFGPMLDSLAARGPDGHGIRVLDDGSLLLGHRRLSIIDLSEAGSQPMTNEDGTIWLTFNGEIYNYRKLRGELERKGHCFRSQSDSEVIIHAYEEWGVDCVLRFRGIFAFGIYDTRQRALFLARDHVGVKPLYYLAQPNQFVFASLARAILAAPGFRLQIDRSAFALYLGYGNVPGDACIFEGVRKLPPAHWLFLKDGKVEVQRYWKLAYNPLIKDQVEAESLVRSRVEEAVRSQLVSDVPLGVLLSGGIDSTLITALSLRHSQIGLSTFNLGFDERASDESAFAQLVADHFQTNHLWRRLTYESACETLGSLVEAVDEPFDLNGLFPYYNLAKLVRTHDVKVALGGDGADEVFGGYTWYEAFQAALNRKARFPGGRLLEILTQRHARNVVLGPHVFFRYNGFFDNRQQCALLGLCPAAGREESVYRVLDKFWDGDKPTVLAAQIMDFNCFLVDHCLTKVDRASMAHGLEVRVPFLDVDLLESVFSIDHSLVFHEGRRKAVLKRAMAGWLPPGMDVERKKGFSSPITDWLAKGLGAVGKSYLIDGALVGNGLIKGRRLASTFKMLRPRMQLALISAELWCRRWVHDDHAFAAYLSEKLLAELRR